MTQDTGLTKIHLRGIMTSCIIGVKPEERMRTQPIEIDVWLWAGAASAGRTDDLADTVDYGALSRLIVKEAEQSSFHLLEALAEHIVRLCLHDPRVKQARVRVKKPQALKSGRYAAVEITRMQGDV